MWPSPSTSQQHSGTACVHAQRRFSRDRMHPVLLKSPGCRGAVVGPLAPQWRSAGMRCKPCDAMRPMQAPFMRQLHLCGDPGVPAHLCSGDGWACGPPAVSLESEVATHASRGHARLPCCCNESWQQPPCRHITGGAGTCTAGGTRSFVTAVCRLSCAEAAQLSVPVTRIMLRWQQACLTCRRPLRAVAYPLPPPAKVEQRFQLLRGEALVVLEAAQAGLGPPRSWILARECAMVLCEGRLQVQQAVRKSPGRKVNARWLALID
jgi:hypothetical protein